MRFEMIYDEEELDLIMKKEGLGEFSEIYRQIKEIYPLKLKTLKRVTCKGCGFCCKSCNVMLSKQDIDLLCRYLQCSFEELYEKYMDKNARIPYLKLPCPFLNKDNECDVYVVRPKPCREFPFNELTVIVDPCPLGKDIRQIIEEIEGPITEINEDMQKAANENDKFFNYMINNTLEDTGRHLRINVDIQILEKMMGYIKHKRKEKKKEMKLNNE
jgi:Fe-S-cluster containining protein